MKNGRIRTKFNTPSKDTTVRTTFISKNINKILERKRKIMLIVHKALKFKK